MIRTICLALSLLACSAGCGASAINEARTWVARADTVCGAGARVATVAVDSCTAESVALAEAAKFPEAHKRQDECKALRDKLEEGGKICVDSTAAADAAISTAEKAGTKDYAGALAPLFSAVVHVVQIFKDAGLAITAQFPGVI